ncbi:hypothetical protein WJX82_010899 [Trebouxia sp. C0006]
MLFEAIEEAGPENVVQVITDSAANCKAAGKLVEQQYPHIFWAPCAAHSLDLLLEAIGKLSWVKNIVKPGKTVLKFVMNHQKSHAIFKQYSKLELLRPGETRFATVFIMLDRMREAFCQAVAEV